MYLLLYLYLYLSLYHLYFLYCKCISIWVCWFKYSYTYITCFAIICLYNLNQLIHIILWWNISWCSKSLLDIALKCSEDLDACQKKQRLFWTQLRCFGPSKSNRLWALFKTDPIVRLLHDRHYLKLDDDVEKENCRAKAWGVLELLSFSMEELHSSESCTVPGARLTVEGTPQRSTARPGLPNRNNLGAA